MAAGRTRVCFVGFSVALWFLVFYAQLIILKSMEKDIRLRGGQLRDSASRHGRFLNLRFINLRP